MLNYNYKKVKIALHKSCSLFLLKMTYRFKNDRKKIVKKKYAPSHPQLEEVFLLFCRLDTLFDLQSWMCLKI